MNKLEDYIIEIENIIPNNLSDNIVSYYKSNNSLFKEALVGKGELNINIRNCYTHSLDQTFEKQIFDIVSECIKIYNNKFKLNISKDTGYQILKYEKGGFYREHVDQYDGHNRAISCSLILNNDFLGGNFSFFNNKIILPVKKNSVLMFPSNFMYPHQILPISDGTRYSIITWFV